MSFQMAAKSITTPRLCRFSRDSAPHLFDSLLSLARSSIHTCVARTLARWWGIEIGERCRCYGLPLFRRLPGSTIRIGHNCQFRSSKWSNLAGINRPCVISTLEHNATIEIGDNCGFSGTIVACASSISIGNGVMCGANVTISDTDWHAIDSQDRQAGRPGKVAPVVIGDDVWLGMNVIVLKGVEIGSQTVVGAGSIVTRSLPAGVIAAGQPAVAIRQLTRA
jgi:acetyltransferase-like isoleucine patch superfamily enzyme